MNETCPGFDDCPYLAAKDLAEAVLMMHAALRECDSLGKEVAALQRSEMNATQERDAARAEVKRLRADRDNAVSMSLAADADRMRQQGEIKRLRGALENCYTELALHTDGRTYSAECALARAFILLWPDRSRPPSVVAALGGEVDDE